MRSVLHKSRRIQQELFRLFRRSQN